MLKYNVIYCKKVEIVRWCEQNLKIKASARVQNSKNRFVAERSKTRFNICVNSSRRYSSLVCKISYVFLLYKLEKT